MGKLSGQVLVTAVGKIRKSHWQDAQDVYIKRLKRYALFKLVIMKHYIELP